MKRLFTLLLFIGALACSGSPTAPRHPSTDYQCTVEFDSLAALYGQQYANGSTTDDGDGTSSIWVEWLIQTTHGNTTSVYLSLYTFYWQNSTNQCDSVTLSHPTF